MPWLLLILAGLCEVIWAVGLKYSAGFTRITPSLITAVGMVASIWLLALAMRHLPLGTAYAIWTGIGAVGSFILGIFLFGEAATLLRFLSAGLLVMGMIGLKLTA